MTTIKKQFEFEDVARGFAAGVKYIRNDLEIRVSESGDSIFWNVFITGEDGIFEITAGSKHPKDRETHPDCSTAISSRDPRAGGDHSSDAHGGESADGVPSDEGSERTVDVTLEDNGSIVLFTMESVEAHAWVKVHLANAITVKGKIVVEHRYVDPIVEGMRASGLVVK